MASGDSLQIWTVQSNQPTTALFATLDARNSHLVLDFDGTTAEAAVFSGVMPQHYSSGEITARYHFMMTTATSGNIVLEGSFERHQVVTDDLDTDSFGTAVAATAATTAAAGVVYATALTFTTAQLDAVARGDSFRFKVRRLPSDAGDTATGDLELLRVELREV